MAIAPLDKMTVAEIHEYVENLEQEIKDLRKKTDNRKKLDERDAARIRQLWDSGNWTQAELGHAFNVNDATINRIVRGIYYPAAA